MEYNCVVTVGYSEKLSPINTDGYFNSAMTVYEVEEDEYKIINYRQATLDVKGKTWTPSEKSFWAGEIPGLGRVMIGIGWDV